MTTSDRLDPFHIKRALKLAHHYESTEGRVKACERAILVAALTPAEASTLRRAMHVPAPEGGEA